MMTDAEIRAALDDTQALAITLFGEGRGEPIEGRIAIACVVRNRVAHARRFQPTYRAACLARAQFSCWIPAGGAKNFELTSQLARAFAEKQPLAFLGELEAEIFRETWWIAEAVIGGILRDRVHGATHYYSPAAMVPRGAVPAWARGLRPVAEVHGHLFYIAA